VAADASIQGLGWHEIKPKDLPQDRTFRNAWASDGKSVSVNFQKARTLKLASIRSERDQRLQATDGEMMRLQEQCTQAQIGAFKAKRQTLRDIPQTVSPQLDAIDDADTLRDFQPQWPT